MLSDGGPKLYVRRITSTATPLTREKLYRVETSTVGEHIIADNGVALTLASYQAHRTFDHYFKRVWVWPNGTEVEELP